ncbi:MAG TPA: AAA family ATPase [Gemmatimonadales bacterium]|nr:AAA family ATPase [Gemmatimonadales bacterium]
MSALMQFKRAVRTEAKLKILITGASGSGKTLGALRLAESLAPGRIAVIDSENSRSSYYADGVEFDVLTLADHHPDAYIAAMEVAVESGYEVIIVDSLSHAWQDVLDRKTAYDRANPRSNTYTNWKLFSAEWDTLVRAILDIPAHVIATARSKQAYEQAEVDGKKKVLKLGLQPVIRDGTEYEFALHFDLNEAHKADVKKDNTRKFSDPSQLWDLCDGSIARELREWLAGAEPVARPTTATVRAIDDAIAALPEKRRLEARRRWAARRDRGVTEEEAREMLARLQPPADGTEEQALAS